MLDNMEIMRETMKTDNLICHIKETIANVDFNMQCLHNNLCTLVEDLFKYIPAEEVMELSESCHIQTWNKGYDFICTGLKKRGSDGCIMMVGTYCGEPAVEFLSYVYGYEQDKKFLNTVIKTFNL